MALPTSVSRHWLTAPSGGGATGMAYLRSFLQSKRSELARAPILVIASDVVSSSSSTKDPLQQSPQPAVQQAIQHVQFTLAQQLGLRTVSSTISSAFPTLEDVESKLELARRTGADSTNAIVAVGSGAAMDLAKAVIHNSSSSSRGGGSDSSPLVIMVPATYPACWACGSSHSLLLDSTEGAILPYPPMKGTNDKNYVNNMIIAPLESKFVSPLIMSKEAALQVVYAATSIALDSWYRNKKSKNNPQQEQLLNLISKINTILDGNADSTGGDNNVTPHEALMEISYQAGSLMSFGLDTVTNSDRSSPLALATSLLAQDVFPPYNILTYYASLLPGMCQIVIEDEQQYDNDDALVQQVTALVQRILSSMAGGDGSQTPKLPKPPQLIVRDEYKGFSVPDMTLSHIHANQALWNCLDVNDTTLIRILQHSIQ